MAHKKFFVILMMMAAAGGPLNEEEEEGRHSQRTPRAGRRCHRNTADETEDGGEWYETSNFRSARQRRSGQRVVSSPGRSPTSRRSSAAPGAVDGGVEPP